MKILALAMVLALSAETAAASERVVFMSTRSGEAEVWLGTLDGQVAKRLTHRGGPIHFPRCSPDGARVSYERGPPRAREVWVLDLDTQRETKVATSASSYSTPSWSPDGRWIIYTRREGEFDRIALARPDGSGGRDLTRNGWHDVMGSYAPDGRSIVFHSYRHGARNPEIYLKDLRTGRDRRVTDSPAQDYEPATDGRRVVFSSNRDGGAWQIYEQDLAGGEPVRLAQTETDAWQGRYGPGGDLIFVTGAMGAQYGQLIRQRGQAPQSLWARSASDYAIDWCPRQRR